MKLLNNLALLFKIFFISFSIFLIFPVLSENICDKGDHLDKRYLLYDVNPGEGFNLRRDVYLRVANLVRHLNELQHWILVLPPWSDLYHWRNTQPGAQFPWREFFDLSSLRKWIPVIELQTFIKQNGAQIDSTYLLQHYAEGWKGKYEDKFDKRDCIEQNNFKQVSSRKWSTFHWGKELSTTSFSCLSYQGSASKIIPLLTNNESNSKSVFIHRAEVLLHDSYGDVEYWAARRSMKFASHLIKEANLFRKEHLEANLENEVISEKDWRDFKPKPGSALGGPYLSVHLRRRDFVKVRPGEIPTIASAANQIEAILLQLKLKKVFVATDSPLSEINELKSHLKDFEVYHYKPSKKFLEAHGGEGGSAIIDQIISSHARYFIGSFESTFSFRIQEEREILGFSAVTTFNRFCGTNPKCEQPSKWTIVYS